MYSKYSESYSFISEQSQTQFDVRFEVITEESVAKFIFTGLKQEVYDKVNYIIDTLNAVDAKNDLQMLTPEKAQQIIWIDVGQLDKLIDMFWYLRKIHHGIKFDADDMRAHYHSKGLITLHTKEHALHEVSTCGEILRLAVIKANEKFKSGELLPEAISKPTAPDPEPEPARSWFRCSIT